MPDINGQAGTGTKVPRQYPQKINEKSHDASIEKTKIQKSKNPISGYGTNMEQTSQKGQGRQKKLVFLGKNEKSRRTSQSKTVAKTQRCQAKIP